MVFDDSAQYGENSNEHLAQYPGMTISLKHPGMTIASNISSLTQR
jgi:hypothetical protein